MNPPAGYNFRMAHDVSVSMHGTRPTRPGPRRRGWPMSHVDTQREKGQKMCNDTVLSRHAGQSIHNRATLPAEGRPPTAKRQVECHAPTLERGERGGESCTCSHAFRPSPSRHPYSNFFLNCSVPSSGLYILGRYTSTPLAKRPEPGFDPGSAGAS